MKTVVNAAVLAAVVHSATVLAAYPPRPENMFVSGTPWTKNVAALPVSPESAGIISAISAAGGWGGSGLLRTDFSIKVLKRTSTTPLSSFTPSADWYSPDCDNVQVPLPVGGSLEGQPDYECHWTRAGDCHLIVHDAIQGKLYEMWVANKTATQFKGGCLAVWNTGINYDDGLGRGLNCTSADAAGLPIAPLLFTADEIYDGVNNAASGGGIKHAIRFILPNNRIRYRKYVAPATHSTGSTSGSGAQGSGNTPPYGTRLRLKATFDMSRIPTAAGRVVARALQTYGMILADAGKVALTAAHDSFTERKWVNVGFTSSSLDAIRVDDFEVVDFGTVKHWGSCTRNGR